MYVVVKIGGKQYQVAKDQVFETEKLDLEVGATLKLDALMLVDGQTVQTGAPTLNNVSVTAQVMSHGKQAKITVYKYKAKKRVRTKQGHRQQFTALKVLEIVAK